MPPGDLASQIATIDNHLKVAKANGWVKEIDKLLDRRIELMEWAQLEWNKTMAKS